MPNNAHMRRRVLLRALSSLAAARIKVMIPPFITLMPLRMQSRARLKVNKGLDQKEH